MGRRLPIYGATAAVVACLTGIAASADTLNQTAVAVDLAAIKVSADPAVRRGVLPNGLHYAVMQADHPKGGVSLRLGFSVGSYEEADDERGFAHFIEHMAFRATRDFPDAAADRVFARKGVVFGQDINAFTELLTTQYQLDLPKPTPADIALGLKWLRNVADGIDFAAPGIAAERGVVLAEKADRDNVQAAADRAIVAFLAPTSRSTSREPIGTEASLQAAGPSKLQTFYRRWYKPENAIVVMVGDQPLDAMVAKIEATFGTWRADGPPSLRAARTAPDMTRGLEAFAYDKSALIDLVQACRIRPSYVVAGNSLDDVRRAALEEIAGDILGARFRMLKSDPTAGVLAANLSVDDNLVDLRKTCLSILPAGDDWAPGLRAAQREVRRFAEIGPTETEVGSAIDNVRSHLRGSITEAPNRTTSDLANSILNYHSTGRTFTAPREAMRDFDLAVEGVGPDDVRAAFTREWNGAGPLLSATSSKPFKVEALSSTWRATEAGPPLPAFVDPKVKTWDYGFGAPGDVVHREVAPLGDYVRIKFRNGVWLDFKRTEFAKDSIAILVRFGFGRQEIDRRDYLAATLASALFAHGGVGKYSFDDFSALFQGDEQTFSLTIGNGSFHIAKEVTRPNLSNTFSVLTAYLSDPGFRSDLDPLLQKGVDVGYRLVETIPAGDASIALLRAVAPDSANVLPPRETLRVLTAARAALLLKPIVTQAPLEVAIVGDLNEKEAISLVAETFGALPARSERGRPQVNPGFLRFPSGWDSAPVRSYHSGPAEKSAIVTVWPLFVANASRRREEYAIDLVAAVFDDELRRRVRVDLGKSYAPTVVATLSDAGDQGAIYAAADVAPGDVDATRVEIRALAEKLRAGDISAEQLARAREPLLAGGRRKLTNNQVWAGLISQASREPGAVNEILDYADLVSSISLEEVRKAAATWLAGEPFVAIADPKTPSRASNP